MVLDQCKLGGQEFHGGIEMVESVAHDQSSKPEGSGPMQPSVSLAILYDRHGMQSAAFS